AMQQALPLTLDWLSRSPDPDLGLRQLRLLLANTPDHGSLATLIHTNPVAGERLCLLLGTGELLGALLDRIPEFATKLAADRPDSLQALQPDAQAAPELEAALAALAAVPAEERERLRAELAALLG